MTVWVGRCWNRRGCVSERWVLTSWTYIYITTFPSRKIFRQRQGDRPPRIWWEGVLKGYDLITSIASVKLVSPRIFLVLNKSCFCLFCSRIISMMFNQDGGMVISKKGNIVREWMWPSKGKLDDPVDVWVLFNNLSFLCLFLMPSNNLLWASKIYYWGREDWEDWIIQFGCLH